MVTERFVLTEKHFFGWEGAEFMGQVMHASKNFIVVWSDAAYLSERLTFSVMRMPEEDFYGKFSTMESILNSAGIKRMWNDGKRSAIVCAIVSIRPTTVTRGYDMWNSRNIEGTLIAWHAEACRTMIEMFDGLPNPENGTIRIPPPLQTKMMVAERDIKLARLFRDMGLGLVGHMTRCPEEWHSIKMA